MPKITRPVFPQAERQAAAVVQALGIKEGDDIEIDVVAARTLEVRKKPGARERAKLIVAAALLSGCDTLYSEDLHHRQRIDGLLIRNPFLVGV